MSGGFSNFETRGINNAHVGVPEHFNGTATSGSASTITPASGGRIMSILIKNTHASNSLDVCFDGSSNYFTLDTTDSGRSMSYSGMIDNFRVKGNGGDATYQAIVNREPNVK